MAIALTQEKVKGERPFHWQGAYLKFSRMEYLANPEIMESFPDVRAFRQAAEAMILPWDRHEAYLWDGIEIIGMIVTFNYVDYHYGKTTGASVLWVSPDYRGRREVQKLVVKALYDAARKDGSQTLVRTTKLTPYVTKQIARRING